MAKKFKPIPTVPFEVLIKGHEGINEDRERLGSAEPTVSLVRVLHKGTTQTVSNWECGRNLPHDEGQGMAPAQPTARADH